MGSPCCLLLHLVRLSVKKSLHLVRIQFANSNKSGTFSSNKNYVVNIMLFT